MRPHSTMMKRRYAPMPTPPTIEALAQPRRQLDEHLRSAEHVVGGGHRHEHEADREEHLVEMRPGVHPAIERRLENRTEQRGEGERERQRDEKRHA